jgi:hypothetical protein
MHKRGLSTPGSDYIRQKTNIEHYLDADLVVSTGGHAYSCYCTIREPVPDSIRSFHGTNGYGGTGLRYEPPPTSRRLNDISLLGPTVSRVALVDCVSQHDASDATHWRSLGIFLLLHRALLVWHGTSR